MYILAIDPGRTTGVCILQTNDSKCGFEVVTALEMPWESRFELLKTLIDGTFLDQEKPQPPEAVVVESFALRSNRAIEQTGSDFPSSQIIGIVEAFLWMETFKAEPRKSFDFPRESGLQGFNRLHFQQPSVFSRVAIEPEHVVWVEGSEHKKDAYRHARYYYIMNVRAKE